MTLSVELAPLDQAAMTAVGEHLDQLTKPPGSLGRLESLVVQLRWPGRAVRSFTWARS